MQEMSGLASIFLTCTPTASRERKELNNIFYFPQRELHDVKNMDPILDTISNVSVMCGFITYTLLITSGLGGFSQHFCDALGVPL